MTIVQPLERSCVACGYRFRTMLWERVLCHACQWKGKGPEAAA